VQGVGAEGPPVRKRRLGEKEGGVTMPAKKAFKGGLLGRIRKKKGKGLLWTKNRPIALGLLGGLCPQTQGRSRRD